MDEDMSKAFYFGDSQSDVQRFFPSAVIQPKKKHYGKEWVDYDGK